MQKRKKLTKNQKFFVKKLKKFKNNSKIFKKINKKIEKNFEKVVKNLQKILIFCSNLKSSHNPLGNAPYFTPLLGAHLTDKVALTLEKILKKFL